MNPVVVLDYWSSPTPSCGPALILIPSFVLHFTSLWYLVLLAGFAALRLVELGSLRSIKYAYR